MRLDPLLRPRYLAAVLGGGILAIAVIAIFFAGGPGATYRYTADVTKWAYGIYLLFAGILLVGIGFVAVGSLRAADMTALQAGAFREPDVNVEEPVQQDWTSEDLPAPLAETPAGPEAVEEEIDELLAALETIQDSMDERQEAPLVEVPAPQVQVSVPEARPTVADPPVSEWLRARRSLTAGSFLGPAVVDVAVVMVCAILLPGVDVFLQTYYQLNTAVLLGLAYSYPLIALYTALSVYAILRNT